MAEEVKCVLKLMLAINTRLWSHCFLNHVIVSVSFGGTRGTSGIFPMKLSILFYLFIYFYCSNFHKRQIGVKLIIVINFGDVIMRLAIIIYGFACTHCAPFYC